MRSFGFDCRRAKCTTGVLLLDEYQNNASVIWKQRIDREGKGGGAIVSESLSGTMKIQLWFFR